MKGVYFLLAVALMPLMLTAQMRQMNWVLGSTLPTDDFANGFTRMHLKFNPDSLPQLNAYLSDSTWHASEGLACLSSKNSELLFYATHNTLRDSNSNHVPGSENMHTNPNPSITQSVMLLPLQDDEGLEGRYVLWVNMQEDPDAVVRRWAQFSVIDQSINGGLGGLIEGMEATRIWEFSLSERLAAVRHGNGKDWWIVSQKGTTQSTKLSVALVGMQGVMDTFTQEMGTQIGFGGESVFSPNGQWYSLASGFGLPKDSTKVLLFSFDRCTGQFALHSTLGSQEVGTWFYGLAFSQDSKKLYAGTTTSKSRLYQITWDQSDIFATQLAAVSGGYHITNYGQLELGPDGQIYVAQVGFTANSFNTYLGVIDYPNEEGLACNYRQQGLSLEGYYMRGYALPNFANYDLGPWEGSPCDTIPRPVTSGIVEVAEQASGSLFPNPSNGTLWVNLPWAGAQVLVYDLQGRVVHSQQVEAAQIEIKLPLLPEGLYFLQATSAIGEQWSERFVYQLR